MNLRSQGHNFILPRIRTERFKRTFIIDVFLVLFRLQLVLSLVMNFCTFVGRCTLLCN